MSKFIVLDIVFYAGSLNYDQGSGNYQELKKITKWDGKQYTLVSRYAIRYSILEIGKKFYNWKLAEGKDLQPANNKVIQPSDEILLSGKILDYPEFDLFGYLITSTTPQNFRSAPVKISHAVSLTPFCYDALFNANIGLANRIRKTNGEMSPNPFTSEEHETFYQYTLVIDVDKIGQVEVYLATTKKESKKEEYNLEEFYIDKSDEKLKFTIKYKHKTKEKSVSFEYDCNNEAKLEEIIIPCEIIKNLIIENSGPDKEDEDIKQKLEKEGKASLNFNNENEKIELKKDDSKVIVFKYKLRKGDLKNKRIEDLLNIIMNLKRSIKGRLEDLSPKLMIVGLYDNTPYETYKDKIILVDSEEEKSIDEIIEDSNGNKKIVKIIHKFEKSRKPRFKIENLNINNDNIVDKKEIVNKISEFIENKNEEERKEILVYVDPSIELENTKSSENNL